MTSVEFERSLKMIESARGVLSSPFTYSDHKIATLAEEVIKRNLASLLTIIEWGSRR